MRIKKDDYLVTKRGYSLFYKVVRVWRVQGTPIYAVEVIRVKPDKRTNQIVSFGRVQFKTARANDSSPVGTLRISREEILRSRY